MNETTSLPLWAWLLVMLILGGQGTLLFLDARRKGRRAWLWGLLGLIQFPFPTLIYWYLGIRRRRFPAG